MTAKMVWQVSDILVTLSQPSCAEPHPPDLSVNIIMAVLTRQVDEGEISYLDLGFMFFVSGQ